MYEVYIYYDATRFYKDVLFRHTELYSYLGYFAYLKHVL